MRFGTKTTGNEPDTDPEAAMARKLRRVALIGTAIVAISLAALFILDLWLGWLSKAHRFVSFVILYSFILLLMAYVTIVQIRYYRRVGQNRIGAFGVSRRAWEVRQIGFLVAGGSFVFYLCGVPAEIAAPFLIGGIVASVAGFAFVMGSSLGTGFATLGVLLSAGGALYNALAGTEYTKPIVQSIIYAGMGLVAVGMIIFFIRRWRRNKPKDGDDHVSPGNQP